MGHPLFFEKKRTLHRSKHTELIEGSLRGAPFLLRKIAKPGKAVWKQFVTQTQIHHPLLLNPQSCWFAKDGSFRCAIPLHFSPGPVPETPDLISFCAELLSLAYALHQRQLIFRWSKDDLLCDPTNGQFYLAGLSSVRAASPGDLQENEGIVLSMLEEFLVSFPSAASLLSRLKAWSRKKKGALDGCLRQILMDGSLSLSRIITRFDEQRKPELELVRGLLHLATRATTQTLLFYAEEGTGKSTLALQSTQLLREANVNVFDYASSATGQPYSSILSWVDSVMEPLQARNVSWIREIGQPGFTREDFSRELLSLLNKHNRTQSTVFVVDDVHLFDELSLDFLCGFLHAASRENMLFLLFSETNLDFGDGIARVQLGPCSQQQVAGSFVIPLWREEQKKRFLQEIFVQFSGNGNLVNSCLSQEFDRKDAVVDWSDGEWFFCLPQESGRAPQLRELHGYRLPEFNDQERRFVQLASLEGQTIHPELIEPDAVRRDVIIGALTAKGILRQRETGVSFQKPFLAETIAGGIAAPLRRSYHAELARTLQLRPELAVQAAYHFCKSGEFKKALDLACSVPGGRSFEVLGVLEQMERDVRALEDVDQLRYYRVAANLFARSGNYSRAARYYARASELCDGDATQKFSAEVQRARCSILNNDIFAAQTLLQSQEKIVPDIKDPRALMAYWFSRATVQRHRGSRESESFEKAVSIAEKLQDHEALAMSSREQAELSLQRGQLELARSFAKRALRYATRIDGYEEAGHALRLLGSIATRRQRKTSAVRFLKRSLRMFRQIENKDGQARVWNQLGNLYFEQSLFSHATHAFQNALALFAELNHPLELGLARFNLGRVYMEQNRLREAASVFERCASSDKKAGNKRDHAFDLRALAAACVLQGFYRKAAKLLKRSLEIFGELRLDYEVFQTQLILIHNDLEQGQLVSAGEILNAVEKDLTSMEDPGSLADVQHLAGRYFLAIDQPDNAIPKIEASLHIALRGKNHKLGGQNLILRLIANKMAPARDNPDLKRAIRLLKKGGSTLEAADSMLWLYRAFPKLAAEGAHRARIHSMLQLYRSLKHRKRLLQMRELLEGEVKDSGASSISETWPRLLEFLNSEEAVDVRLKKMLSVVSAEMNASSAVFQFINTQGIYERFTFGPGSGAHDELRFRVLQMMPETPRGVCLDLSREETSARGSVHSMLAIPVRKADQMLGMWCFERTRGETPFTMEDLNRASFFLLSAWPIIELILMKELSATGKKEGDPLRSFGDFIGSDPGMKQVYRHIENVSPMEISVLILGESGTGKELVARNIHRLSGRVSGPFVALNCSAIPESLVESELFGFNKGAFTGAAQTKPGVIERANGGTLFLDEIGDLSPAAQVKLLRVIQEREIRRLGDTANRKIDVRFLFATHKDLKKLSRENAFREDLYYRISNFVITLPPLRERRSDIPLLLDHFLRTYGKQLGRENVSFAPPAMKTLTEYSWSGNVREMENMIQTLLVNASSGGVIDVKHLSDEVRGAGRIRRQSGKTLEAARQEFERQFLTQTLQENRWNKTQTAKQLQITRQGLINLIQRLGITEP